jgi:hypothetical protein
VTRIFKFVLLAGMYAALASAAGAENLTYPWQVGTGFYTTSGKYGTDSETTSTYIPFSLRRRFEPGFLELVIPYVSATTAGDVVVVGGVPNHGHGKNQTSVMRETHSGLGDITLKGAYYAVNETAAAPQIDAVARVMMPTAGTNLGIGKWGAGGGLEFSKRFRKRILAEADAGYLLLGGDAYQDQWYFSLGGGYYFRPEKWVGTLSYEERRSLIAGETNPRDLLFFTEYHAQPRLRLYGGLQIGVSETAPDVGLLFGGRFAF